MPEAGEQALDFPLRGAAPESLARIRAVFRQAGFDEITLCRELKIPSMSDLGKVRWPEFDATHLAENLRELAGLFLFGERAPRERVRASIGAEGADCLLDVGLLRQTKSDPSTLVSPVFLYPVGGFLITSDRHDDPDGSSASSRDAQADVVFPGIFGGTLRFLELLPKIDGGAALDLCGGCGIGALCLAREGRLAVSADITPRATRFAAFNAQLNDCATLEAVCGDLYEPVTGRQFDVITAHPPYVPALGNRMIYRDAGDAGEDITRGIIAGLPAFLRPGGRALILCQGRDASEGPFEQRARGWLGDAAGGFDIVFALQTTKTLEQEASEMARRVQQPTREELAELVARFRKLGTKQFVYGALAIYRHRPNETVPYTYRTRLSAEARGLDIEPLFAWHHRRQAPGFADWLGQAHLRLAPHLELHIRHLVQEGSLVPAEFIFEVDQPFASAMRIDGWITPLIARLDGKTSPREIHEQCRSADELPIDFQMADFLRLIATLVERGYLIPPA